MNNQTDIKNTKIFYSSFTTPEAKSSATISNMEWHTLTFDHNVLNYILSYGINIYFKKAVDIETTYNCFCY